MHPALRRSARSAALRVGPVQRLVQGRDDAAHEVERLQAEVARLRREAARAASQPDTGEYPPGHFHSPLPDPEDVRDRAATLWAARTCLPGIDVRDAAQVELLGELVPLAEELASGLIYLPRFSFDNEMIAPGDALVLWGMLRRLRPRRVVEVGSGHSSALMLDADERHLGGATQFTFIDPYPERLHGLLSDVDRSRVTVHAERAELLDLSVFAVLEAGDLLFIDSSHVSRIGSDVNHLFLEVVPALPPGVVVHVHDMPWPFEYWRRWVDQGRWWNEAYLVRALLTGNPHLQVLWFSSYMEKAHRDLLDERWPAFHAGDDAGASLWLRTV